MKKLILVLVVAGFLASCGMFSDDAKPADPCAGKTGVSGWMCKVRN